MKDHIRVAAMVALVLALAGLSACAIPRAVGKTAGGIVKTAGKVVSGTAKAVTKPLR